MRMLPQCPHIIPERSPHGFFAIVTMIVAVISVACDSGSGTDEIRHPTDEYLDSASQGAQMVFRQPSADEAPPEDSELVRLAQALRSARQVWSVGTADGPPETMFGEIRGAAVDSMGRVYVLDSQHNEVRRFNSDGEFLDRSFGPGQGPLEFQNPEGIAIDAYDRVIVASRSDGIKAFVWDESQSGYDLLRHTTTVLPRDMCMTGGTIFARVWRTAGTAEGGSMETLVHGVDTAGTLQHSFASVYPSESSLVSQQVSDGRIGCVRRPDMVVNVFERIPIIRAYSVDGDLQWTSVLADVQSPRLIVTGGGTRVGFGEFTTGEGLVTNVVGIPGGYMIVQVLRQLPEPEDPGDPVRALDSYLLSARTGRGAYVGESLPLVLAAREDRFYAQLVDVIPQVAVYEYVGR